MQNHVPSELVPFLPPSVSGTCRELLEINGKIKIRSSLLQNKQISLKILWWGETNPSTAVIDENNSFRFVYQIRTSRALLQSYFLNSVEFRIILYSENCEIGSSRLKTKDISAVPRIYFISNNQFRIVAKIKVDFRMLGVCSRVVDYKTPLQNSSFRLRVDCLKIRQAYKFSSLVTTDFKVLCRVNGMEFEYKSSRLCDDSMEIYFMNDSKRQVILKDEIHFKVVWRTFGSLEKEKQVLGEGDLTVLSEGTQKITLLSRDQENIADLFIVLGPASQDSGDFSLSEGNSPRGNENDQTNDSSKDDQSNDSNGNEERLNLYSCEEDVKEVGEDEALDGLFYVGRLESSAGNSSYILTFKTFWSDESISTRFPVDNNFNFLHEFHVTTSQSFLEKVKNNNFIVDILNKSQELFGSINLPLQQYYVAFRDQAIINHLKKSKHPVISMDGFAPIISPSSQTVGKLQVTLAIGTKEQIEYLKNAKSIGRPSDPLGALLEKLKNQMQLRTPAALAEAAPEENDSNSNASKYFQFMLEIDSAFNLPKNPAWKKGLKKTSINYKMRQSRYPPNEEPFAYVTFQAEDGYGSMVKSHEGMVYASKIAGQSSNPIWNQRFQVVLVNDYINVDQKRFIMKVWKKAAKTQETIRNMQPCPMEDAIIGFSAIDLSPFRRNANITGGVYNIVDFNGRINGQIKISANDCKPLSNDNDNTCGSVEDVSLSRAMKRKFTELEEISQRLRARLFDVTGEANPDVDFKEIDDEEVDEFERDLNTECVDDDGYEHGEGEFDWLSRTPSEFNTGRMCPKEEKMKLISEFMKSNSGLDSESKE